MDALEGVAMELDDCGFPTLQDIVVTDDPNKAFDGCNWALLVGAFPRKQGMERKDLLGINGKIFVGQGKALAANAAKDVRILVVGNPCNTNCLVAYHNGRDIPAERWTAMTRLDHNRAVARPGQEGRRRQRATSPASPSGATTRNTQYPDFTNAKIKGKPATEVITDRNWLENDLRAAVPEPRHGGHQDARPSRRLSAANGALDHVKSLLTPTPAERLGQRRRRLEGRVRRARRAWSSAIPCRSDGKGNLARRRRREARRLRPGRSSRRR